MNNDTEVSLKKAIDELRDGVQPSSLKPRPFFHVPDIPPSLSFAPHDIMDRRFWVSLSLHKSQAADYKFFINTIDDIDFKKIADDLSYSDPLRIVESNGKMWAIVHHTIYDKYLRSEEHGRMVGKAPTAPIPIQSAILYGVASIEPSQIKNIVKEIRRIKQSRWTDRDVQKSNVVKVTKVQV